MGCTAAYVKHCLIIHANILNPLLAGIVEAYWEYRLKPWDVCAGVLVLEEAGGRVTTMDGLPYR